MGVSRTTAGWLVAGGHDVVHVSALGMKTAADTDIVALATREQRVLLTFDLDFGDILAASGGRAPSVIIFRLSSARPERVNARLEPVLRDAAAALEEGAIVIVEDERHRVRRQLAVYRRRPCPAGLVGVLRAILPVSAVPGAAPLQHDARGVGKAEVSAA